MAWVITLLTITLTLSGLFYLKHSISAENGQQGNYEPAASIEAAKVELTSYQPFHSVIGESVALRQVLLKNQHAGQITQLDLDPGKQVTQNQLLLTLEHGEELAQLNSAKASAKLNQQTVQRYQQLHQHQRISLDQLDIARSELAIANAHIARIKASIEKKFIRAPFTAMAGLHNLAIGQMLESHSEITELVGIDEFIWVDFMVPQTYPALPIGSKVIIAVKEQQQQVDAVIISTAPLLSSNSRQLRYRAKVLFTDLALKPNHLVKVKFPTSQSHQVITVPELAIIRDLMGQYVFVVNTESTGTNRVTKRKVNLGERIGDRIIVKSGLSPDDQVAGKGAFKLREGMKAFIKEAELNDRGVI